MIKRSKEEETMLNAYYGEFGKQNQPKLVPHSLEDLHSLIDHLCARPPVSSYPGRATGHHAWIIVSDHGFDLQVYFGESTGKDLVVSFVLYGPYSAGEENSIYDGRGLHGDISTENLKTLLGILDQGRSPVDFVHGAAIEVSVVTD